ncbi:transcriptional regulator, partial [Sodalis sp.]|uniref:transcriptional regulator n=1 Tax=Sodalis sp. (in: enterobacteria) TaxID=1898979 RepID=UPI003873020E
YEFLLDRRHTEILITGYDVKRRAAVIDRWFVLESERTLRSPVELGLPNFLDPAEAAIAWGKEHKAVQLISFERDEAIRTKAEIGSRREATAMATASVAVRERNKLAEKLGECLEHSTVLAVKRRTGIEYSWRPLRQWCIEHGVEAITVPDPRYGAVRSWPAEAWMTVHSVNLHALFREVIYA